MRHLFFSLCVVLGLCLQCIAQCGADEESYDYESTLNERERERKKEKRIKEQKGVTLKEATSSSDGISFYPTHTMTRGVGFSEGFAIVRVKGRAGFIDKTGKLVIEAKFRDAKPFCDGLAAVEVNSKWGFINKKGQLVIPAKFDWALSFSEERAAIRAGEKWGFIDRAGKVVIKPQFDEVYGFSEDVAAVVIYDKDYEMKFINRKGQYRWGFIDKNGGWALPLIYDGFSRSFNKGMALVSRDIGYNNGIISESYFIDKSGRELWVLNSWYITMFSDDLLVVANKDKSYSYVDRNGKPAFDAKFKNVGYFSEGLAYVQIDGKYGFIDKQGQLVIDNKFNWAREFSEGLAGVTINKFGKWGFIDKTGKIVIELQFDWVWSFVDGIAPVAIGEKVGYIDKKGNYIWKPTK